MRAFRMFVSERPTIVRAVQRHDLEKSGTNEKVLARCLRTTGYVEITKNDIEEDIYESLKNYRISGDRSEISDIIFESDLFIHQPFGSHKSPDFVVVDRGVLLFVEAKSSKNGKPMWNSSYPQPNFIYAETSHKHGINYVYTGADFYGNLEAAHKSIAQFEEHARRLKELCDSTNARLASTDCPIKTYQRKMFDVKSKTIDRFLKIYNFSETEQCCKFLLSGVERFIVQQKN